MSDCKTLDRADHSSLKADYPVLSRVDRACSGHFRCGVFLPIHGHAIPVVDKRTRIRSTVIADIVAMHAEKQGVVVGNRFPGPPFYLALVSQTSNPCSAAIPVNTPLMRVSPLSSP